MDLQVYQTQHKTGLLKLKQINRKNLNSGTERKIIEEEKEKTKQSICTQYKNIKLYKIHARGIPEENETQNGGEKGFEKIMSIFPKFDEIPQPTDKRNSIKLKKGKDKQNHTRLIIFKLLKINYSVKIVILPREK